MGRPRGRPRKAPDPDIDDEDEAPELAPSEVSPEVSAERVEEITPDEARRREALDSESAIQNDLSRRIVAANREGKKISFNGEYDIKYNQAAQVFRTEAASVTVERIYPSVTRCITVQLATVPTFDMLDRLVREHYWNGEAETYRYRVKDAQQSFRAQSQWSYPDNPEAKRAYQQRVLEAQRSGVDSAFQAATQQYQQAKVNGGAGVLAAPPPPIEVEDGEMIKGYWATNGSQLQWVPPGAPCPPGYYVQPAVVAPVAPVAPVASVAPVAPAPSAKEEALEREIAAMRERERERAQQDREREREREAKERERAQQERERERERELKETLTQMQTAMVQLQQQLAVLQHQAPAVAAAQPESMVQLLQAFAQMQQAQQPAPAQQVEQQRPVDVIDSALSLIPRVHRLASLAGSAGASPKDEAALGAAPAESPSGMVVEQLGAGLTGVFKRDGSGIDPWMTFAATAMPHVPKVLDSVRDVFGKWAHVQELQAMRSIEESRKAQVALSRAMQELDRRDRELARITSAPLPPPPAPPPQPAQEPGIVAEIVTAPLGAEPSESVPSQEVVPASDEDYSLLGTYVAAFRRVRPAQATPEG